MDVEATWSDQFQLDVEFGYVRAIDGAPQHHNPRLVLNGEAESVLRVLRDELKRSDGFTFSVAFVTPRAIALLKQELVEFGGPMRIVTSDYLGFNRPEAFAELLALTEIGADVRVHTSSAFHPKGYVFRHADALTAIVGSSNLTEQALVRNHEWNLRVTAAGGSDLAEQIERVVRAQVENSVAMTQGWLDAYSAAFMAPRPSISPRVPLTPVAPDEGASEEVVHRSPGQSSERSALPSTGELDLGAALRRGPRVDAPPAEKLISPNQMQQAALDAIAGVRAGGAQRAAVISATGTGKTILSALDARNFGAKRLLFVVHREQILDRTIEEYRRVLGGAPNEYGKLAGTTRQSDRRYVFATVQTLSKAQVLETLDPDAFDYIVIDEAHRAGAKGHQAVIDHFSPKFLLGMTATPERPDGYNIFQLFDHNIAYEIRLNQALEAEMLAPFHYYGVADVLFEDGTTVSADSDLSFLVADERVDHVVRAIETYGQAGVPPRGLIFVSRKAEAHRMAAALSTRKLRGVPIRAAAITGEDLVQDREDAVRRLEAGQLDYIVTVDVFNEGVDIPSLNQVVMLRQTQSPIVFVQQLGRGLRKSSGKEYLVVIDVIGNYANNFLIPIALFGDNSLNKESLRKNLIAAEESGVLPGLSSVRFDKISQARVLQSIASTNLTANARLKAAIVDMQARVGREPKLSDFHQFESVDPVVLATAREHFPALLRATTKSGRVFGDAASRALQLLSHEVMTSKRRHEFIVLEHLIRNRRAALHDLAELCARNGLSSDVTTVRSVIDTFTLEHHSEVDQKRYGAGVAEWFAQGRVGLTDEFLGWVMTDKEFADAVIDIATTGAKVVRRGYDETAPFTVGRQYSRKDTTRLLNLPRKWTSTLYGYKADPGQRVCPAFVTLHKAEDVSASTAYEDAIIDRSTMVWYSKSQRSLASATERALANNEFDIHMFVKKDDAEGSDFYYLGQPRVTEAIDTTINGSKGPMPIVRFQLKFDQQIDGALFDYFHPTVTAGT